MDKVFDDSSFYHLKELPQAERGLHDIQVVVVVFQGLLAFGDLLDVLLVKSADLLAVQHLLDDILDPCE